MIGQKKERKSGGTESHHEKRGEYGNRTKPCLGLKASGMRKKRKGI